MPLIDVHWRVMKHSKNSFGLLRNAAPEVEECWIEVVDVDVGSITVEQQFKCYTGPASIWLKIVAASYAIRSHELGD